MAQAGHAGPCESRRPVRGPRGCLRSAIPSCDLLLLAGSASGTGRACSALCRAAGLRAKARYRLGYASVGISGHESVLRACAGGIYTDVSDPGGDLP